MSLSLISYQVWCLFSSFFLCSSLSCRILQLISFCQSIVIIILAEQCDTRERKGGEEEEKRASNVIGYQRVSSAWHDCCLAG